MQPSCRYETLCALYAQERSEEWCDVTPLGRRRAAARGSGARARTSRIDVVTPNSRSRSSVLARRETERREQVSSSPSEAPEAIVLLLARLPPAGSWAAASLGTGTAHMYMSMCIALGVVGPACCKAKG